MELTKYKCAYVEMTSFLGDKELENSETPIVMNERREVYVLTSDEMNELLGKVHDDAYKAGLSGYPIGSDQYKYGKEQFIQSITK